MDIEQVLTTKYHQEFTEQIKVSLIHNLTNLFTISNEQAKFSNCISTKKAIMITSSVIFLKIRSFTR